MNGLIIGSGAYVTGRNNSGSGTILASLMQYAADTGHIHSLVVTSPSASSGEAVDKAASELNRKMNSSVRVSFEQLDRDRDFSKYLDENNYDFAVICVPDHLHTTYLEYCIGSEVPTLVVKPFTDNYEDAVRITELAKSKNVYGAVEFHKRWDESNLYLKRRIREKAIGDVLYFDVNYSQRIEIPAVTFRSWAERTNIFQYLGVHYVDLVYFMTGYRPVEISTRGLKKILKGQGIDTWDAVIVSSRWKAPDSDDDFIANYHLSWVDPNSSTAMSDQHILCVGTEGRVECDQKHRGVSELNNDGPKDINPYFSEWILDANGNYRVNGYGVKSIEQFAADVYRIRSEEIDPGKLMKIRPSFEESLVSTRFIDVVNQQLKNNDTTWTKLEW